MLATPLHLHAGGSIPERLFVSRESFSVSPALTQGRVNQDEPEVVLDRMQRDAPRSPVASSSGWAKTQARVRLRLARIIGSPTCLDQWRSPTPREQQPHGWDAVLGRSLAQNRQTAKVVRSMPGAEGSSRGDEWAAAFAEGLLKSGLGDR